MELNNGKFRRTTFVLRRYVNGIERTDSVFPIIENITSAFESQPSLTLTEFVRLSESEYLNRLSLFYSYLEFKYPFFKKSDYMDLEGEEEGPTGTNLVLCPIDSSSPEGVYVNFDFERIETQLGNMEGILDLVLERYNGESVTVFGNTQIQVLLKESTSVNAIDWDEIQGNTITLTIPDGQSRVNVLPLFRFEGINMGDIEFKNIYAKITDVSNSQSAVLIGPRNLVYTTPGTEMYLANIITNIGVSYQDFPTDETIIQAIVSSPGLADQNNIVFTFEANINARPVFIYPADMPDLLQILSSEEETIDLISTNAFTKEVKELVVEGHPQQFKVYASRNQVIYPKRVTYKFYF